jgi:chromosome partitioning protein
MHIIAVANQKGGVGKTTSAVNLAEGLAEQNQRVLLIDLDPQGNATQTLLGQKAPLDEVTVYDFLLPGKDAVPFDDVVVGTRTNGVDLLPSNDSLEVANKQFAAAIGGQMLLQRRLKNLSRTYNYILIDTQPSLSLLTINGLAAAQELIVPITPGLYETSGLITFRDTVQEVAESLNNATLHILGVLLTRVDTRRRLDQDVIAAIEETFGKVLFRSIIPINVKVQEAVAAPVNLYRYAPQSSGAKAYAALVEEVLHHA